MASVINSLEVKLALLSNAREKDLFVLLLKSYAGSSFKDTRKFLVTRGPCDISEVSATSAFTSSDTFAGVRVTKLRDMGQGTVI